MNTSSAGMAALDPTSLGSGPTAAGIDAGKTPRIPLARLVRVELRKLVDTRSGRWLLIVQALLIVLASTILVVLVAAYDERIALMDFTGVSGAVMAFLLPIMGIMAVTSEWSQRTNMTTFTLEPRRERVLVAKLLAAVSAAVLSVVVAIGVGYVMSAIAAVAGVDVDWSADLEILAGFALTQVLGLSIGFAFGTLLLNTPAAIVCYLAFITVVPAVLAVGGEAIGWFADVRPWLDYTQAQLPLTDSGLAAAERGFDAVHWGHFAVSGGVWFLLPLVLGFARTLRAEIS
jgi:hypothetical protein